MSTYFGYYWIPCEKPDKHQYRNFMNEQHKKKSWKNKY